MSLLQKENTWFITAYNNRLSFWSGIKVLPDSLGNIRDGNSFIKSAQWVLRGY
jgi:two-component system nitrogen regulation sensor histidine kinase NtrY